MVQLNKDMNTIHGIDPSKPITPIQIRDAIVERFFQIHHTETGFETKIKEKISHNYCKTIIQNAFKKTGGDFDHPTKQSILNSMNELAKFSLNFHDQETIKKYIQEIKPLIKRLPD